MKYRRTRQYGGSYFFTIVTHQRKKLFLEEEYIEYLSKAFKHVRIKHPFSIDAMVLLPDHLHCILTLPHNSFDYATRLRLIKHYVTYNINKKYTKKNKIWQKRYWEHCIRDERDWKNHMDYIHFNPVKHGYVSSPKEWPYSSFSKLVEKGFYTENWAENIDVEVMQMEFE